jgi:hypothetical protein
MILRNSCELFSSLPNMRRAKVIWAGFSARMDGGLMECGGNDPALASPTYRNNRQPQASQSGVTAAALHMVCRVFKMPPLATGEASCSAGRCSTRTRAGRGRPCL